MAERTSELPELDYDRLSDTEPHPELRKPPATTPEQEVVRDKAKLQNALAQNVETPEELTKYKRVNPSDSPTFESVEYHRLLSAIYLQTVYQLAAEKHTEPEDGQEVTTESTREQVNDQLSK